MGVTGLWDILRPSGKLRSLTHVAVVDGFEGNPSNLRGLRIGIDASIWFFHAAYGRDGENPELRTLFFRCARLTSAPFLPIFIFDGPKRPKFKRGKKISGEKHWLVDSMKGIIEAFGFEWRMAPGEAEAELAHLNSTGVIDAILSDDVDNFLFGARMVIRNPSVNLTGNNKHATKNADGRVDGNHSTIYTSADILAHPSVQLTRGGLILIGLLSGGDYHPAGLSRCGPGIAHGLAKCGLGDELLEAAQSLTRTELSDFLTTWRDALRSELRTNARGHLGTKKPSLAKTVPDTFPDVDVLLSYTNPITSATDAGARRTHTPPRWECEPDLAKMAHLCELHFEWGLKDIIIKRFRTVLWPSIVLRALRRSALETYTNALCQPPCTPTRERESHQDSLGTPSKLLARHFSSMALEADGEGDEGSGLRDLIVKIHSSRTHAYTDGILEYRLEIAPAPLVRLASAGIQGLRKPADTTYDVLPSESDDSDDGDDEDGCGGTGKRKKRRGGPPPEPESHVRVWMPACMVRIALPDLVEQYKAALEAKRAKKSRPKAPKGTARAPATKGKRKATLPSRKATEVPPVPADAEYFDLDVSSTSEESDGRASPLPLRNHSRPLPARNDPLRPGHSKIPSAVMVRRVDDVFANSDTLPADGAHQHSACSQESPRRRLDVISNDRENDGTPGPSESPMHHISSPSKVLQRLDLNLGPGINISSKARLPITPLSSPPRGLQPLPIAFEDEEEFSDGDRNSSGPSMLSDGQNYLRHAIPTTPSASSPSRRRRRWSPIAREEEESSDDMDAVPGELPALRVAPRGQPRILADSHMPSDVSPRPERVSSGLKRHARPPEQPSPSKARRNAQHEPGPAARSPSRPSDRRVAETSIISISSDSDNGGDGDDDVGLSRAAPLLIARSRSAVSRPLAMASAAVSSSHSQGDLEHEVIDLT
ncbi:hypothetical protein BC826DRAFT_1098460 [Russula brevipes]|nr:hypothetical protein BC826DRAFT_1098460 [Russula brevipes]